MSALQVKVTIDRQSPVPLYHQLAQQLSNAITVGQLQPGDPFENEIAVAERLLVLDVDEVIKAVKERLVARGLTLVENGHLLGALPAGGADRISANPAADSDDELALDAAAMEFGTD